MLQKGGENEEKMRREKRKEKESKKERKIREGEKENVGEKKEKHIQWLQIDSFSERESSFFLEL